MCGGSEGCCLGMVNDSGKAGMMYPELVKMQTRAILSIYILVIIAYSIAK
jgi:hypothetical protein